MSRLQKSVPDTLREVANDACMAAYWFTKYETNGNPEHRINALRLFMDARDTLKDIESTVTQA